jgi:serpin B
LRQLVLLFSLSGSQIGRRFHRQKKAGQDCFYFNLPKHTHLIQSARPWNGWHVFTRRFFVQKGGLMKLLPRSVLSCLVLSLLLAGCTVASEAVASSKERTSHPLASREDLQKLVDGNNTFSLDLYQSLRSESGNLVSSPYSISLALAMTYAGAGGQTESQMADVLNFNQPQAQLHPSFNALDLALQDNLSWDINRDHQPLTLNLANAVWAEKTSHFQQEFLDTLALQYGSGVHLADFKQNSEFARKEINRWVSDTTKKKIKNVLPEGSLDASTRMVLVNAIYFKADWLTPFDPGRTRDFPFTLLDGTTVMSRMMYKSIYLPYVKGDGYQAVELPYGGIGAVMDIILPAEGNFEPFESSFSKDRYDEVLSGMQDKSIQLGLPRFNFSSDITLKQVLKNMGMPDAFDPNLANFSGMTGEESLYIDDVFHKAFIIVNEKGTEAAAASAVVTILASGPVTPSETMILDRPFLFIIRDKDSGQILFIGRVLDPSKE